MVYSFYPGCAGPGPSPVPSGVMFRGSNGQPFRGSYIVSPHFCFDRFGKNSLWKVWLQFEKYLCVFEKVMGS